MFDEQTHNQRLGSLIYIAPEVMKCRNYNTIADIYNLAVITSVVIITVIIFSHEIFMKFSKFTCNLCKIQI